MVFSNFILLGDTLFQNYVITFDKQKSRIGFSGNYETIDLIGTDSQVYFYDSQISMAIIAGLLSIVFIILLGLMIFQKRNKT
jgi:hypothetical protein